MREECLIEPISQGEMNNRILVRIDFQNDFIHPNGSLSINNPDLIEKNQQFNNSLQKGMFAEIIDAA